MDAHQHRGPYDMPSFQMQTQNSLHGTYGGAGNSNDTDQFDQGKLPVMPRSNLANTPTF